jgi:hypothetical protein
VFGVFFFLIEVILANVFPHPLSSPWIHLGNVFLLEERVKGGRHLLAHATIMSHARSGQTLSPRRHWNLDFNIPNVFSILTRVLLCARFNVVCGPGAGLGYGVMSVGRHGYPRSPRIHPSNCPAIKYKLWAILHKHNYMRSMICSECNSPSWNLRLKLDSRYILASWTEPGHFASTLVIMWEASHII